MEPLWVSFISPNSLCATHKFSLEVCSSQSVCHGISSFNHTRVQTDHLLANAFQHESISHARLRPQNCWIIWKSKPINDTHLVRKHSWKHLSR